MQNGPSAISFEKMLRCLLREHIPAGSIQSQRGNLEFVVRLDLCDAEEVMVSPFGEVKEITMGYGGTSGASVLQNRKYSELNNSDKLREYINFIKSITCPYFLSMFGLQRVSTSGGKETVEVKLNKREINISDPKHFCCKLHIVLNKLLPQRRINLPKYLHVHCHPIREGKSKMNWGETFENIRDTAITSYCRLKNSPDHGVLVTPKFYH